MITRKNYESFFIDYLEGHLDENLIDPLMDFLNRHPDLKEELHLFETITLPEEHLVFQKKEMLKKTVIDEKEKQVAKTIACMEGDLDPNEKKLFETYLDAHPDLREEYRLFGKTRLIPDLSVKFVDKRKLYHQSASAKVLTWVYRAVAIIVLAWGINSVFQSYHNSDNQQQTLQIAQTPVKENTQEKMETPTPDAPAENHLLQDKPASTKPASSQATIPVLLVKAGSEELADGTVSNRDTITMEVIRPHSVQFESQKEELLASAKTPHNQANVMSLEEYLAYRAKKAERKGILSLQNLAKFGLDIVSEVSGERMGYKMKNGKISSVEFESKLLAVSIPIEKK
jgi:hypothetical protein